MPFSVFKILDTDKLRSGFRAKYNATLDKIIKNVTISAAGIQTFITQDDTELEVDLKDAFYTKSEINTLTVVPAATEATPGRLRIATWEEVTAGLDDATVITPYKLSQLLGRDAARYVEASEDIQERDLVNIFLSGGILKARKAIATSLTTLALAVADESAATGEEFRVRLSGSRVEGFAGLTPGIFYYLSTTTPATFTPTPLAGAIRQAIGYALSETELFFQAEEGLLMTAAGLGLAAQVHLQSGNAFGAPAVIGTTDSQPVQIITNNTNRVTVSETGRTGFGTTDPQATVDVRGNAWVRNASDGAYLGLSATAAGGAILDFANTTKLHFRYNEATTIATISATGVGINTPLTVAGLITSTVADGSAPMQVASLTKVVNLNADLLDGQHGPFYQDAGNINAGTLNIARHPNSPAGAGTGTKITFNASGHPTLIETPTTLAGYGITDALTPGTVNYVQKSTGTGIGNSQIFDNGTAVGVGTNSPQVFFDVRGPMWVRQADASYFSVDSTTSGGVKLDFSNTAKLGIGYSGGARIATFTSDGRTGFGTTEPGATVDVRGTMWVRNPVDSSYFSVTPTSAGGVQLHAANTGKLHLGYNETANILTVWGEGQNRVGINKETPSEALDVVGNVLSSGDIKAGAYLVSSQTLYSTAQTTGGRVAILDGSGNVKASRTIETIAATDAAATITGAWTFSMVPTTSGTPSASNHLATVGFVNSLGLGVKRGLSVKAVATDNINTSGLQTVRGYTLQEGDRILRVGQAAAYGNGVWIASAGDWTRATDSDSDAELRNYYYTATEGASAGERWANTNASTITVDTTDLTYERDSSQETDPTVPAWVKAITSDQAANLAYMVRTNGSYANPAWLTSLAASKLTGADEILSLNNVAALSPTGVPFKQDGTWSMTGGIPQSQTPALTAFLANSDAGYLTRKSDGTFASRTYQAGTGIAITYPAGQEGNSVWSLAPTGVGAVTTGPYQFDGFGRLTLKRAIDFTTDIINIPEILGGSDKRPPTFSFSTLTVIAGSSFSFAVDVAGAKTSYHAMSDIAITRITATSGAINFNYDPATKILSLSGTLPQVGSFSVNIEAKDNLDNNGGGTVPIVVVPPGGGEITPCPVRPVLAELYGLAKVHEIGRLSARFGWSGPAIGGIGSIRWKTFTLSSGEALPNVTVQAESYQSGNPEGNSTQFITLYSPTAHYTNYTVNVSQAGTFKLSFFHACADSTNALKYQINGGSIVTKTLTNTGGWDAFATSSDSDITLNAGTNTIKLMGGGSSVKIDYFTLKYPAGGGGGGVVRTLYDTGTVPGNTDRPLVTFSKEHAPGVSYIFEIQGETCTSTPDETPMAVPADGYTLTPQLWNNDGSGLNSKVSDITPGASYEMPVTGWEVVMVIDGISHNNYSTRLEQKQADGSYQLRFGETGVQIGSTKTSGSYELFGTGNNISRAVAGNPIADGVYRYTFTPYQGGLKQREYTVDFTLTKTIVVSEPTAAAYFYDDTNNAVKGQITTGQSFTLPTSWDVQYTMDKTDADRVEFILSKTGVAGNVFTNGSAVTPFALTTCYLFNPGQLNDSSNLDFEGSTPLRAGSYTLQVALRKNNVVFRTDTFTFTIAAQPGGGTAVGKLGFIGNSITRYGYDPGLTEWNNYTGVNSGSPADAGWGMAASTAANDFVHKVAANYGKTSGEWLIGFGGVHLEQNFGGTLNMSNYDSIRAFQPDTLIVRLGENATGVNSGNVTAWKDAVKAVVNNIVNGRSGVRVFITGIFWNTGNAVHVDAGLQAAATELGATFVELKSLGSSNYKATQFADAGIQEHPNDAGMSAIAGRINAAISGGVPPSPSQGEMFTKSRMGFTNPGGNPADGVPLIQQNKTLGFNSLGTAFAYDFQTDADLQDANWPEYNHVTNSSAASSGSPHTFDATVHQAYLNEQELRTMIGLNRLWREINGRNGITAYYGTEAMHMKPDGSPTYADNDPDWVVPNASCISLSHPVAYPLALQMARLFIKRYKPAIQANIIPLFGMGYDKNAEAQMIFEITNGRGETIGQPKGDFNDYAIAEFKTLYPQHAGADKNAIANASYSTALGSDWQYYECDKMRRFEWRLIADLIAEFPWLAEKKFWMIDAGSHADGLSHIRRTFAVQSRINHPNYGFVKANDNPHKYYLFDYLWSAGRYGAITYEEITPTDGAINNNSKADMVKFATRCRKLGIGLSWLTQGLGLNGIFQQIAQEAGLYSISTRQMPDPADVRTCNLNLSAIIAGGTSYLEDQWTAAGGSETKFVQFIVNDDKALS